MADDGTGLNTAAKVTGAVGAGASIIPVVGPIISGIAAGASGIMEMIAAGKQKQQAALERQQANALQPDSVQPEFLQKLRLDQMAALGGAPGAGIAKNDLATDFAANMRAIQQTSSGGATTVNAISNNIYKQQSAMNKLAAMDEEYRAGKESEVGADLSKIGVEKNDLRTQRNTERDKMLGQAAALENASMGSQQTGINTIGGAIGATATNIEGNEKAANAADGQQNFNAMLLKFLADKKAENANPSTGIYQIQ